MLGDEVNKVSIIRDNDVSSECYQPGSDLFINLINPLGLHDALKHHYTSLKTDLIFLQQRVLERKFPWNWFTNTC